MISSFQREPFGYQGVAGPKVTLISPNGGPDVEYQQGAIPVDYQNALLDVSEAGNEMNQAARPEDVTRSFQKMHAALTPVVEGNLEMQELHQELGERIHHAHHLHGHRLRDAHIDIFIIFFRILLLINKQMRIERDDRQRERDLQTKYLLKVADNFATQGKWLLNTAIGAGILSILSGVAPILQHSAAGDTVYGWLPTWMKSNAPKEDLFKGYGKMFYAMSEINKNTGQIHGTYSEGWRTTDHHKSEIAKMLGEDWTRSLEDDRGYFNNLINALVHELQSEKDVTQQLCRY
jgi:hypothetical protein